MSMNIFTRTLGLLLFGLVVLGWQKALSAYDGLVSTQNMASLIGMITVLMLVVTNTYARPQLLVRVLKAIVALAAAAAVLFWLSGLTLVLGLLIAVSVVALALLFADIIEVLQEVHGGRQSATFQKSAPQWSDDSVVVPSFLDEVLQPGYKGN